jgi:twinkle protein
MGQPKNANIAKDVIEEFEQYNLRFMDFYGSTPVETIFETLKASIYDNDISVVCIDNMQFMLSNQAEGFKKFDLQDKVTSELRKLATELDIHIFLVVHPKKVEDDT